MTAGRTVCRCRIAGTREPLCHAVEPLEGVVEEDELLVTGGRRRWRTVVALLLWVGYREVAFGKLIKVGCVIDALHLNAYGCWSLSNMLPIDAGKEWQCLEVGQRVYARVDVRA